MAQGTRASRPMLTRQRLTQPLVARAAPLSVLLGPAGLGKSVLLADAARQARRARVESITSPDGLVAYANRLTRTGEASADLVLVDGISAADGDALATAIRLSRDSGAYLVVATRTPLAAVTPGMVLDGSAHIFSTEDLRFTRDEVTSLATRYKLDISPDDATELHRATDGWPAMVDALLRSRQPGAPLTDRQLRETVDRFVRDEVLGAVPSHERRMLKIGRAHV